MERLPYVTNTVHGMLNTSIVLDHTQTYVVDSNKRKGKLEDDSLDEISSGEMSSASLGNSSHISQNVSEYWDEVG